MRTHLALLLVLAALPAVAQHKGSRLEVNEFLKVGEYIAGTSGLNDKRAYLILQPDANLCLYPGTGPNDRKGGAIWCSMALGPQNIPYFAALQPDANLCVYRGKDPSDNKGMVWCSRSNRTAVDKYFVSIFGHRVNLYDPVNKHPDSKLAKTKPPNAIWSAP